MKLEDVLYKTPEMTEEKLLEIMDKYKGFLNVFNWSKNKYSNMKDILNEWDLIQAKKSKLSRDQRDQICSFVSVCLIRMTKDGGSESQSAD